MIAFKKVRKGKKLFRCDCLTARNLSKIKNKKTIKKSLVSDKIVHLRYFLSRILEFEKPAGRAGHRATEIHWN